MRRPWFDKSARFLAPPMRVARLILCDPCLRIVAPVAAALFAGTWALTTATPPRLTEYILAEQTLEDAEEWKRGALALLTAGSDSFTRARLAADDAEGLGKNLLLSQVAGMHFYDASGRPFWSSSPYDASGFLAPGQLARLGADEPLVTFHEAPAPSAPGGADHIVAEVLTPVQNDADFAGAIRFTSDVTALYRATLRRLTLAIALIAGAGTVTTLGGLVLILRGNRQRVRLLDARAERDAESMAEQVRITREVQLLGELNEWMHSATTLDDLFKMVSRYMSHLLPISEGTIHVYSASRDVLDGWAAWNGASLQAHIRPDDCWALRRGRTYAFGDGEISFPCDHVAEGAERPYYCFPILAHGETVGLMHIRAAPGEPASEFREGRKLAQMCAEQIAMAIANVQMRDQLREQAIRDPVTGLFNRRHMLERLRTALARARADEAALSFVMLDVDHFKHFNDNHGHDAGDMVLRAVAGVIADATDGEALSCRYGGEEFALMLPTTGGADAAALADRLRAQIGAERVVYEGAELPRVTISAGIASFPGDGAFAHDVITAADDALYAAKESGRDRVSRAGRTPAAQGVTDAPIDGTRAGIPPAGIDRSDAAAMNVAQAGQGPVGGPPGDGDTPRPGSAELTRAAPLHTPAVQNGGGGTTR